MTSKKHNNKPNYKLEYIRALETIATQQKIILQYIDICGPLEIVKRQEFDPA